MLSITPRVTIVSNIERHFWTTLSILYHMYTLDSY